MNASTIVSCGDLAAHLNDADWRVFDCRHQLSAADYGETAYAEGHLPGAFFLHLDRDLSGPKAGCNGRHPLPDPQLLASSSARPVFRGRRRSLFMMTRAA